jgi:hypothetical protein
MIKKQTRIVFSNIRLNQNRPYDDRETISSLANIATELPLAERYSGLMFWVTDISQLYWFEADVTTPVNFFASATSTVILEVTQSDQDYSGLVAALNSTGPETGTVINVYPLGVAFAFDGTNWQYAYGTYTADTDAEILTVPSALLRPNTRAVSGGAAKVINDALGISPIVTVTGSVPGSFNSGYYLVNGSLYRAVGGSIYRINNKTYINGAFSAGAGITNIAHNLNTPYVRGIMWISTLNELVPISLKYVDANTSALDTRVAVSGVTVIIFAEN